MTLNHKSAGTRENQGMVLLEIILALVLFVAAAAIITSSLNTSIDATLRHKRQLHAANLAVTVLAELQIGARRPETAANIAFTPPFTNWTSDLVLAPLQSEGAEAGLTQVEVIIREQNSTFVYRLSQALNLTAGSSTNSIAQ